MKSSVTKTAASPDKHQADIYQADIFSLLDDPTFACAVDASSLILTEPSAAPALVVKGWVKTYQGPLRSGDCPNELPTLNHICGDGHLYREATFALSPGVSVGEYPGGFGSRGLRVGGSKEMISLYSAVQQGLAREAA